MSNLDALRIDRTRKAPSRGAGRWVTALLMPGVAGFIPALRVRRLNVVDALAGR